MKPLSIQASVLISALFSAVGMTFLLTGASQAQIYSWRDASGQMHFSDQPPAGEGKPLNVKARPYGTPKAADDSSGKSDAPPAGKPADGKAENKPKTWADKDLDFKKRQADTAAAKAKADKEQATAEQKKRDCERAQKHMSDLQSGRRMATVDANGERSFMDDTQRDQESQDTQRAIGSLCK